MFYKDNETLYLSPAHFNRLMICEEMCKLILKRGGQIGSQYGTKLHKGCKACLRTEGRELTRERGWQDVYTISDPVPVYLNGLYFTYSLNGVICYFQMDENPFFGEYFIKTPIVDGKFSLDAYGYNLPEVLWAGFNVYDPDMKPQEWRLQAKEILKYIDSQPMSEIAIHRKERTVRNTYNGKTHVELVQVEGRMGTFHPFDDEV